jgi:hydrogenase/urease accessory protein HupE
VEHIWTGYDHLLFLLALLLVCSDFKSAIQVVTFFTVAHSITLALATLNLVSVSGLVVEPAIAASIIYVGVENFTRSEGPKGRWLITFLFGLIHGFGFATVLRDLGVTSGTTGVAVPLVAFNLGVEAGQIVIAAILLPAIWKLRKWEPFRQWGVPACSAIVASLGGYWLVERLWFS